MFVIYIGNFTIILVLQDELIREGIELYAKEGMPNWNAVGKHSGLTGDQASKRWSRNLNPALAMRKKGPWSEEEVCRSIICCTSQVKHY